MRTEIFDKVFAKDSLNQFQQVGRVLILAMR